MNWISVRDRLPEDQVEVLVATRSKNGVPNIDKGYLAIDHFIHRGRAEVTHWMPLPEPPKEENETSNSNNNIDSANSRPERVRKGRSWYLQTANAGNGCIVYDICR